MLEKKEDLTWKVKFHPNRFLVYRKLVLDWQSSDPGTKFIDVFSFVWLPFLLFWFLIICPFVAITKNPIFFIYIPVMVPAYIGFMIEMHRRVVSLQKQISHRNYSNFMESRRS